MVNQVHMGLSLPHGHLIYMSYLSRCIGTSCVDSLSMTSSGISRSIGRLMECHIHQLLFFSFHLHQLQPSLASTFILLQHLASSSQLPFAIDAKGGEMFRGRDVLVRGSSPWGGACYQLSSMTKGEIVGQFESCLVWLCLVFVIDVNWVFDWGL